jgi:hypothetical protein
MRETSVQAALAELIGVGTFVDVLLLLHHVILFHEDRPGALWDSNAQRHVLRALFLEKSTANRVAQLERDLNGADSQARNIHPRIVFTERQLSEVRQREAGSEGIVAELAVEQKLLDAELAEADRLDDLLSELDLGRQQARLELERAKIAREDALGAMERLKHTALLRLFPTMDDAARLVISRIMTEGRCLVCKSDAHEKQAELEGLVATGHCPACGANLEYDDNVHAQHEFEQGRLQQAREQVALAQKEEDARATQLAQLSEEYDSTLDRLVRFRQSIADRTSRERRLRSQLPQTTTSTQFESALAVLRAQHGEWEKKAAAYRRDLGALLAANEQTITAQADELARTFGELSKQLVAEDARLAPIQTEPQYTQARGHAADRLKVPAFAAEMTAADRPGYIRRVNPWDVSESQRELIDLAFRLALVRTATHDSASTFVMETPEASLDGVAMGRVALGLAQFASRDGNRLIVTSNLSNSGLITALFGGRTTDQSEVGAREQRVIDLLRVAAPNRALIESRDAYAGLLRLALSGVDNV